MIMGALLAIWWIGALGTSTYYWVTYGCDETYVAGRMKTFVAFGYWYFFLIYLYVRRDALALRREQTKALPALVG
jgi:hypothetical protein